VICAEAAHNSGHHNKKGPAPSTRAPRSEGPRPLRRRGEPQTHCCRLPGSRRWRGGTAASAEGTPRARTHTSPDTDTARMRVQARGACQLTCPHRTRPPPSILFSAHTQAGVSTSKSTARTSLPSSGPPLQMRHSAAECATSAPDSWPASGPAARTTARTTARRKTTHQWTGLTPRTQQTFDSRADA
jgi:hypothetical protein